MWALGFMVDGREGPLRRYHARAGEKVSLGAIAGGIIKGAIIWSRDLRGWGEGELMVRIERIIGGGG